MTSFASTVRRAAAPAAPAALAEGLFARMIRLWLEHHQRMIDFGLGPR